jgi:DNA-binding NarL/FixJ family response regulator
MDAVRVLVASDLVLYREGLQRILCERPGLEPVQPSPVNGLLDRVAVEQIGVVVLVLPSGPDSEPQLVSVARFLREKFPETGLVVVSPEGDGLVRSLLESGPRGVAFLLDGAVTDTEVLARAVLDTAAGMVSLAADAADALVGRGHPGLAELTAREHDVLAELSRGRSNRGIAESLSLTVRTVEANVSSIFRKLGLVGDPRQDRRLTAALVFLHRSS